MEKYVLITPAWNEAKFIEQTLRSVISQEAKPLKWVIVSDGSTDGTDEIVERYAESRDWIELVRLPQRQERHFAAKVHAFNAGFETVKHLDFDLIGNVDADVAFDADHFQFVMEKFQQHPSLGVAGTAYIEGKRPKYDYGGAFDTRDVAGACQIFRRECFEDIGGYTPVKGGGIDMIAVYMARMRGWQTKTFTEKSFIHLRPTGTGQSRRLKSFFRFGIQDYFLGSHPLWQVFRCLYRSTRKPYLVVGLLILSGYMWASLIRIKRPIPPQLVAFRRMEQMERVRAILARLVNGQI